MKTANGLGSPFSLSNMLLVNDCKTAIEIALSKGLINQYNRNKVCINLVVIKYIKKVKKLS